MIIFTHAHLQKNIRGTVFFLTLIFGLPAQAQNALPHFIPVPAELQPGNGEHVLTAQSKLFLTDEQALQNISIYFNEKLKTASGFSPVVAKDKAAADILFALNKKADPRLGAEGYHLTVTPRQIELTANSPAGIFYGVQSLLQCLPKEIEKDTPITGVRWNIPALTITDYPRFPWRGVMLDVSRHFFPKEYVKEYIDQLARYKFNRLHLHLTDDNGWRIEIKSLPLLTSKGAWRVPRTGTFGSHEAPKPGEKATDGGFYTQEDMREIIAFAKQRFIEIVPEIDVPGHSMAAIAAYPELSVTNDTTIRVNPGSNFSRWFTGGFEMFIDNALDPTDQKVYDFLDKVVTEIAALFPYEYIHMGGDECFKGYWEKDAKVQAFMKKNNIKDAHLLQAYFTDRVNKIVRSKNKKMIGWDEILEGGLSPDAAVMSWQGTKGGIAASKRKHTVVMSPAPEYYLDMGQGEPTIEPPIYNYARLKDTYHFNILPKEADSTYVIGGQGNLWTEQIPTAAQVEYMTYPRAFAIAETLWSPNQRKDWTNFVLRTEAHLRRFDEARINYSTSFYDPIISVTKNSAGNLVVEMSTEVSDLDLFYTLDNTIPNQYYSRYESAVELPADVDNFKVISYRGGKPIGHLITLTKDQLVKRVRKSKN
jgi:hexosaminidase